MQAKIQKFHEAKLNSSKYSILNGLLLYRGDVYIGLIQTFREQILFYGYYSLLGGHSRVHKIIHRIYSKFYWKGMHKDVKSYIKECDTCQRQNRKYSTYRATLAIAYSNSGMERYINGFHGRVAYLKWSLNYPSGNGLFI